MLIRQSYIDQLAPFIDMPLVKILTGVRRCGKSTIMLMLMDELKKEEYLKAVSYGLTLIRWNGRMLMQNRYLR